jgi:signal transduction histidine kinase
VWNTIPVEFSFSIKMPFWKLWWIPQLFILFYLIVLSLFFYYRFKKIKFQKAKQQQFTQQLINSQESERKRIAKELHDSVGQNLLIVKNKLLLDNKNNENSSFNIEQTAEFIEESIEEIRSICRDLHPYQLERFGLIKAIQLLIKKVSDVTSIYMSDDIDIGVINFTAVQEIQIYRIVQESLNNIIKHSSATAAKISMHKKKDSILSIVIQDNGKGFGKEVLLSLNKNFGLVGIEERTNLLNGNFYIESDSINGTKYFINIPI